MVFFHAHPDDEAIYTGGTMVSLAAGGHRTVLVTATDGEAGLTSALLRRGLGSRRAGELDESAQALGTSRVVRLGYPDSGSDSAALNSGGFATVPVEEAAARLAEVLKEEAADILTVYDPAGGYGHPDHVRVHEVGRRAAQLAGTSVVLEATVDRSAVRRVLQLIGWLPFLPAGFEASAARHWYVDSDELTHVVDVRAHSQEKRAAMLAHRSQQQADSGTRTLGVFLRLPPWLFRRVFGREWFVHRPAVPALHLSGNILDTLHRTP